MQAFYTHSHTQTHAHIRAFIHTDTMSKPGDLPFYKSVIAGGSAG